MQHPADPALVVGRIITAIEHNPFSDDQGRTGYDPRIILDNGARLTFSVQETEDEYGILCAYSPNMFADAQADTKQKFVAVRHNVMNGSEHICTAASGNMAQRIARALNSHQPNKRGQ